MAAFGEFGACWGGLGWLERVWRAWRKGFRRCRTVNLSDEVWEQTGRGSGGLELAGRVWDGEPSVIGSRCGTRRAIAAPLRQWRGSGAEGPASSGAARCPAAPHALTVAASARRPHSRCSALTVAAAQAPSQSLQPQSSQLPGAVTVVAPTALTVAAAPTRRRHSPHALTVAAAHAPSRSPKAPSQSLQLRAHSRCSPRRPHSQVPSQSLQGPPPLAPPTYALCPMCPIKLIQLI